LKWLRFSTRRITGFNADSYSAPKASFQARLGHRPQERDYHKASAESAIQLLNNSGMTRILVEMSMEVNRAFSADSYHLSLSLGRCPRLEVSAAPLALAARLPRSMPLHYNWPASIRALPIARA
jgi:hypothetical protein